MRLHLIIQRHGLPVTRILWTTSSPSNPTLNTSTASTSAITSTRVPNSAYGNGAYTVAQLLEDVNEVVPLETQGGSVVGARDEYDDEEGIGQWGLEDYVVEVNGFECLHFMEVEGLLRDGDEVVIRALQTADLRARKISGRHQISIDGRHLIDGVPFGKPYLKRTFSARPAIKIPPRKRRRISFEGWSAGDDVEEDVEWGLPQNAQTGKRYLFFDNQDDVESDQGTVIRHPPEELAGGQDLESDADTSDFDEEDLAEELNALREDLQPDETLEGETSGVGRTRSASKRVSHLAESSEKTIQGDAKPGESPELRRSSIISGRRSESVTESPRRMKNVRFEKESKDISSPSESEMSELTRESSSEAELSDASSSDSSEAPTSSEEASSESDVSSDSEESTSESEEESFSESESELSTSEEEEEDIEKPGAAKAELKVNPPGKGSVRTKKTNRRNKLRRKLAKLKELGFLPPEADFAALRDFEEVNGRSLPLMEVKDITEPRPQSKEQLEFEAKRQKLLRDLQSGGVDIDGWSEKENVPPFHHNGLESSEQTAKDGEPVAQVVVEVAADVTAQDKVDETAEPSKKRSLDVASSKRLLFGSLGLRTPKTKEDEEAMREKLTAKVKTFVSRREEANGEEQEAASDAEENWQEKLIVRATECVFDDIELTAPPFPFEQRWDAEAHEIIGQRKGWGKRKGRRKRQKIAQVQELELEEYSNGYWEENGDISLNYDDESYFQDEEANHVAEDIPMTDTNGTAEETDDLPALPVDVSSVPDLAEDQLRSGAIIAFKQLDMSKATNWQPKVSDYRVAEVDSVLEDKTVKVRLAKRDREERTDDVDDEEEGPRKYSGFEMPGLDEETGEDDGFRELEFSELIEPKLLQAAPSEGDVQGVSVMSREDTVPDENRTVSDQSRTVTAEAGAVTISSQTRNEISILIQDAGFRSKIDSDLLAPGDMDSDRWVQSVEHDDPVQEEQNDEHDEQDEMQDHTSPSSSIKSPTFAGFPSSPPAAEGGSPLGSQRSSPSPTAHQHSDRESQAPGGLSSKAHSPSQGIEPTPGYPQLPTQSVSSSRRTNDDYRAPVSYQVPVSSDGPSFNPQSSMPTSSQTGSQQTTSRASSTVPNPFYEVDRAYEERRAQQQDESLITEEEAEPNETREAEEPQTNETRPQEGSPEFDLPPIDVLISSTAPARTTAPPQSPSRLPERRAISSPPQTSPDPYTEQASDPTASPETDRNRFRASEFVDLTQSSPATSGSEGSDKDFARSHGLPRGLGWVQKHVPATRRKTRSSMDGALLDGSSLSPPRGRRRRKGRGRGGMIGD